MKWLRVTHIIKRLLSQFFQIRWEEQVAPNPPSPAMLTASPSPKNPTSVSWKSSFSVKIRIYKIFDMILKSWEIRGSQQVILRCCMMRRGSWILGWLRRGRSRARWRRTIIRRRVSLRGTRIIITRCLISIERCPRKRWCWRSLREKRWLRVLKLSISGIKYRSPRTKEIN